MKNNLDFSKYTAALVEAKEMHIPEGYFSASELTEFIKFRSKKALRTILAAATVKGTVACVVRTDMKRSKGAATKFYYIVDVCKLFNIKV